MSCEQILSTHKTLPDAFLFINPILALHQTSKCFIHDLVELNALCCFLDKLAEVTIRLIVLHDSYMKLEQPFRIGWLVEYNSVAQ